MKLADNITPVVAARDTIKAQALITNLNPDTNEPNTKSVLLSTNVNATNALAGDTYYSTLSEYVEGDWMPAGLAQSIYEDFSVDQWSGTIPLSEAEVNTKLDALGITGSAGIGLKLNLSGGRAEWATMNAMVQEVLEDVTTGRTTFVVGPPEHLSVQDYITFALAFRNRVSWQNPATRALGTFANNTEMPLGEINADQNASAGGSAYRKLIVSKGTGANRKVVQSDTDGDYADHTLAYGDTLTKRAYLLVSNLTLDRLLEHSGGITYTMRKSGAEKIETTIASDPRMIMTGAGGIIDLNCAHVASPYDVDDKRIAVRELDYCENGSVRKILVLCSHPYDV